VAGFHIQNITLSKADSATGAAIIGAFSLPFLLKFRESPTDVGMELGNSSM
jgi:hypothetical protein